jgi:EmrB/QacA subfamily drug resistance transporter
MVRGGEREGAGEAGGSVATLQRAARRPRLAVAPGVVLLLVCLGQFMVLLDISVVNVALPSMRADLGFSTTGLEWVVNAYTLAFSGFLLLGGRAADIFGRRRLLLIGLGLFCIASLADGLATSQGTLLAARALQGLGGAVLTPATLTILLVTYPEGRGRARALGIWSAVAAAGGASGALLGGVITQLLTWRWIFFVNVPIGVLVLIGAALVVGETFGDATARRHLDLGGAVSVTAGLVGITWGIARSQDLGWAAPEVLGAFVAGLVLLGLFVAVEARAAAPLVPLRLFLSRSITGANLVSMGVGGAIFAVWYFQTLYLQQVRGLTPLEAGLTFVPQTVAIMAGSQLSSRLFSRVGTRPFLVAGPLLIALGLLWMAQLRLGSGVAGSLIAPGVLLTFGGGLVFPAITVAATTGVSRADSGLASGLVNTTRQVGGSLGLAVLVTLAADRTAALAAAGHSAPAALTGGFALGFGVGAVIAAAAGLAGLIVPGRRAARALTRPSRRWELEEDAA